MSKPQDISKTLNINVKMLVVSNPQSHVRLVMGHHCGSEKISFSVSSFTLPADCMFSRGMLSLRSLL